MISKYHLGKEHLTIKIILCCCLMFIACFFGDKVLIILTTLSCIIFTLSSYLASFEILEDGIKTRFIPIKVFGKDEGLNPLNKKTFYKFNEIKNIVFVSKKTCGLTKTMIKLTFRHSKNISGIIYDISGLMKKQEIFKDLKKRIPIINFRPSQSEEELCLKGAGEAFKNYLLSNDCIALKKVEISLDRIESINYNGFAGKNCPYYATTVNYLDENNKTKSLTIKPKQNKEYQTFICQLIFSAKQAIVDPDFELFLESDCEVMVKNKKEELKACLIFFVGNHSRFFRRKAQDIV